MKLTNEILKKYRLDNGYSQQEMANKLAVTRELYNKIENGKLIISDGVELKFEKLLNSENISREINENNGNYLEKRRDLKNNSKSEGIIYVPVTAQAGYGRRYKEPIFINNLELAYLPGTKYKGKKYRLFEVEGESMEKTLFDGQKVIAEYVEIEDWQQKPNYYIYVLVSEDMISIKRVFRKDNETWVLISDNEDFYPQSKVVLPCKA